MAQGRRPRPAPRVFAAALAILAMLGGVRAPRALAGPGMAAGLTTSVAIVNYTYEPRSLTVAVGTTVRWTNLQTVANDVMATAGPAPFRSPSLRPGESFAFTFTEPGVYHYSCSPHPFMAGEVRVVVDERMTFPETGFAVEGAFLRYWRGHGLEFGDPDVSPRESLALFGLPLGPAHEETIGGAAYTVQYFERARFEYHPENRQPYDVLLGQFGRALHPPEPPAAERPGGTFFPQTGHNLGGRFRDYWAANGVLPIFGLPLTEEFEEQLGGRPYRVQYFERARLESHPENAPPYDVLLGQFGRQLLAGR